MAKLRDARGAKRRKILDELQRRYDETVSLRCSGGYGTYRIPRYDFALYHGREPSTEHDHDHEQEQEALRA